jgi:hypothetical protein
LQAGALRCRQCGRIAFPTDAAHLDAGLIIATYARPCSHRGGGTLVVSLEDAAPAPAGDSLSLYVSNRRCAGRNRKGRPCRSWADPGSDYCRDHQSADVQGNLA